MLDRISDSGIFGPEEREAAKADPVPTARKPLPLGAPRASDDAKAASRSVSIIYPLCIASEKACVNSTTMLCTFDNLVAAPGMTSGSP